MNNQQQVPNNDHVKREEAESGFQAVAEEIKKRDTVTQNLIEEIKILRGRMENMEASSPSNAQRRKISTGNSGTNYASSTTTCPKPQLVEKNSNH
jgi:hypothetical protein